MKRARADSPLSKSSPMSQLIGLISTGNPVLDRIALHVGVIPQMPRIVADIRQAPGKPSKRVGTRAKYAKVGRTNGMPWDGTAGEISSPATIDARPEHKLNLEQRVDQILKMKDPAKRVNRLRAIAIEVRECAPLVHDHIMNLASEIMNKKR